MALVLATCLVDDPDAGFDHGGTEARLPGKDGGGEAEPPPATRTSYMRPS